MQVWILNKAGQSIFNGHKEHIVTTKLTEIDLQLYANAPAAPSSIGFSHITSSSVTISWTDESDWETAFIIERSAGDTTVFDSVATVDANTTIWIDSSLAPSTVYGYRIYAVNQAGRSASVRSLSVVTLVHDTTGQPSQAIDTNVIAARNDVFFMLEDDKLLIGPQDLLANDSFTLALDQADTTASVAQPFSGELLNHGAAWEYLPAANWAGVDSFTYTIAVNDTIISNNATVTVTVEEVNDAPASARDAYSIRQDSVLAVGAEEGVLSNDYDVDDADLTASLADSVLHGSLILNATGAFSYTPEEAFAGKDSFSYVARDNDNAADTGWAVITVTHPDNSPPSGVDDVFAVEEDDSLIVSVTAGVLINDTDPDGDQLEVILAADVSSGQLHLNSDGSFTYVPDANFSGSDSFSYKARDHHGAVSSEVAVAISITEINDVPRFSSTPVTAATEDAVYRYSFSAADPDAVAPLSFSAPTLPSWLTFTDNQNGTGILEGTPLNQHVSSHRVVLTVSDGIAPAVTQSFSIEVSNTNDKPAFDPIAAQTIAEMQTITLPIFASDEDAGDQLTITVVSPPTGATFIDNGDGTAVFTWTPSSSQAGNYTLVFRASDGTATVSASTPVTGTDVEPPAVSFATAASSAFALPLARRSFVFGGRRSPGGKFMLVIVLALVLNFSVPLFCVS